MSLPARMRAFVYNDDGKPTLSEVALPKLSSKKVLVRVSAVSLNPMECVRDERACVARSGAASPHRKAATGAARDGAGPRVGCFCGDLLTHTHFALEATSCPSSPACEACGARWLRRCTRHNFRFSGS